MMEENKNRALGSEFGGVVDQKPITILIVDDDSMVRQATRNFLSSEKNMPSVQIVEAVDGRDGIGKYMFEDPDIIITDRNMPEKNGFEMVSDIRAIQGNNQGGKIPFIVMQSSLGNLGETEYLKLAYEAGVDEGQAYKKHDYNMYKAVAAKAVDINSNRSRVHSNSAPVTEVLEPKTQ